MDLPVSRRAVLRAALGAPFLLAGCASVDSGRQETAVATVPPDMPTASPTSIPAPTFAPTPAPTPRPPTVELRPASFPQGGSSTVILNVPATSGTATFQGRQYPMLGAGDRRWAVIGTGGFTQPGPYNVSVSYTPPGQAAALSASVALPVTDANFVLERLTLDAATAALLAPDIVNAELNKRSAIYGVYTLQRLWKGAFIRPSTAAIGDTYGLARSYNGAPATDYHRGTDFTGNTGDPIVAAADGKAAFVGTLMVRGNSVILDHGAGVFTAYHHLSHFDVSQGADVVAGQLLGLIGSTGLVTGPHLHWEVIVRGVEVDGLLWLNGSEYGL